MRSNQILLRCFDDKRYIISNGVDTLPYLHFSLTEDAVVREISPDVVWGEEEVEEVLLNTQSSSTPIPSKRLDFLHSLILVCHKLQ